MIENGCRFHSDCLTCPFPDCFADKPGVARRYIRDAAIKAEILNTQLDTREIAKRHHISRRTVKRIIQRMSNGTYMD